MISSVKNYQIKAVKAGVPDISTLRDRSLIEGDELPAFSPLCWCIGGRGPLAFIWTTGILLVCVLSPLISFTADIAFYVTCNQIYIDAISSLLLNQNQNQKLTNGNKTLPFDSSSSVEIATESTFTFELAEKATEKAKLHINLPPEFDINSIESNKRFCDNFLEKLQDKDTGGTINGQIRRFRHLLENIYKPALIIGCVLSTTLCMFFRVVVLGCGHSHLMSAFVVTMLYSCLPVLTGIVSVKAAGFVFGKTSIPCLLDLVEQVNAQFAPPPNTTPLPDPYQTLKLNASVVEQEDRVAPELVWFSFAFLTKAIDSLASGYMLFVVTFRSFLRKHGHEHIWWHFARALGIIVALVVWMCVMPLLVLSPSIGWVLFGTDWSQEDKGPPFSQDISFFDNNMLWDSNVTSAIFYIIFIISAVLWGVILLFGAAYFIYRSYLYKRRQE